MKNVQIDILLVTSENNEHLGELELTFLAVFLNLSHRMRTVSRGNSGFS